MGVERMAHVGDEFMVDYPATRKRIVLTGKLNHGASNAQSTIFVGNFDPNDRNLECVVNAMGPYKHNKLGENGESTEPEEARAEYDALRIMGPHPNIVKLIAYAEIQSDKGDSVIGLIILEKLSMDVNAFIRGGHFSEERTPKKLMYDLLSAVQYCRRYGIVHTDIKPANIFVDLSAGIGRPTFKLGDFASSIHLVKITHTDRFIDIMRRESNNEEITTLHWRALELMLPMPRYAFTSAIDVWSCGCVFADMLFKRGGVFFNKFEVMDMLEAYFKFFGTPNEYSWPSIPVTVASYINAIFPRHPYRDLRKIYAPTHGIDAIDLLCRLLDFDGAKRITAEDALKHPYFK